ncbi:hypothetical protein FHS16_005423 [Paenibacillus endophyticus]|uniref:Uncharacterized protein n=1 Tax=Paenibacillus endophyticus TaxID=1294268 RepID=A0A7W5CCT3_9BACL|nr:hypothetical protein [Paenibacillus endophyticus]
MTNKMSMFQMYSVMLVLLLGTSIIFGTPKLVMDMWLVPLFTILPAILLFLCYTALVSSESRKGLYAVLVKAWGNVLGKALCSATPFIFFI